MDYDLQPVDYNPFEDIEPGGVTPGQVGGALKGAAQGVVGGLNAASNYFGIPQEQIKNPQGDVVFPTNALERGLQSSDASAQSVAAGVMGPGEARGPSAAGARMLEVPHESGLRGTGGTGGTGGVPEAPGASSPVSGALEANLIATARLKAQQTAAGRAPLEGLPQEPVASAGYYVPGPSGKLHDIAESYMKDAGLNYVPPKKYSQVDKERAGNIAIEYDEMSHAPSDPKVAEAYDAMIKETLAQYQAIKKAGIKFDFIQPGMKDPYGATPRLAAKDVQDNSHLWVFPTESGFGTEHAITDNPLLRDSGEVINGKKLTNNDVFRIVHDVFGHLKDGNGFRAAGEENAWRSHSAMYSDVARKAMTSETRGQNSWVNFGPHGEANRKASAADTVYADQKVGLLPQWAIDEGRLDEIPQPKPAIQRGIGNIQRNQFPEIYGDPREIARDAAQNVAPEHPALKELFGVTRDDLYGISQQGKRQGNIVPSYRMPANPKGSYVSDALMTPENAQRLVDIGSEAAKYPNLIKGMDAWYTMDPAYQQLERLHGPDLAKQLYRNLNNRTTLHSPGSPVEFEWQRGTSANQLINQGQLSRWVEQGGVPSSMGSEFADVPGHIYHSTSQAKPLKNYEETGDVKTMSQPKVPLYMQASGVPETGFQTSLPVPDTHYASGLGAADVREAQRNVSSMKGPEYHAVGPWYRENVAKPLGIEAVPAQARQWGTLAHITGVKTQIGAPKLEILAKLIWERAQRLGVDPKALRDAVLSGKAHASYLTPGIMTALAAAKQSTPDEERQQPPQ